MRKRFIAKRRKNHKKFKLFIYSLVCIFGVYLLINFYPNINIPLTNQEFIKNILHITNHHMLYSYDKNNVLTKVMQFFSNVNLDNPVTILDTTYNGLTEFNLDLDSNENIEQLKKSSTYIEDPDPKNNNSNNPEVYIYSTHQLENYKPSNVAEYNVGPNVMLGSYILREKLNNLQIPSMVETGNVMDILDMNNWNYSASYQVSRMFMEDAKEKNPSLKYFVDFHRDSVSLEHTLLTKDDKNYARILFIVGLENPQYEENLHLTEIINSKLEEAIPGISRGIYKKEGPGVNGVYNQDFSSNTILIEVGGVDNSIEEVYNSIECFAKVFASYIKEAS